MRSRVFLGGFRSHSAPYCVLMKTKELSGLHLSSTRLHYYVLFLRYSRLFRTACRIFSRRIQSPAVVYRVRRLGRTAGNNNSISCCKPTINGSSRHENVYVVFADDLGETKVMLNVPMISSSKFSIVSTRAALPTIWSMTVTRTKMKYCRSLSQNQPAAAQNICLLRSLTWCFCCLTPPSFPAAINTLRFREGEESLPYLAACKSHDCKRNLPGLG